MPGDVWISNQLRNRARQVREQLAAAAARHQKMKARYLQTAEAVDKYWQKVSAGRSETLQLANQKSHLKVIIRHCIGTSGR